MDIQGLYINLATSTERDAALKRQLASLRVADRYRRFDAIRGADAPERAQTKLPPGHLGCWLSHEAVWREGRAAGRHLHVLEDDAVPSPLLVQLLPTLPLADDDSWDLVFTDVYLHPPPTPHQFALLQRWLKQFEEHKSVQLADLKDWFFTGTTSYLANRRSLDKLLALTQGRWADGRTIDVHLMNLVRAGKLNARVTVPFLSTVSPQNLQTTTGAQGPALAALNALREALFYAADRKTILARANPAEAKLGTEPLLGLYLGVLRQVLGTMAIE